VETALHHLVVKAEKALDKQETALGVLLDIEGAFNTIRDALVRHCSDHTIVWWIRVNLDGRVAVAALNGFPFCSQYPGLFSGGYVVPTSMVPVGRRFAGQAQ
jgi:hypothetical protein